MTSTETTYRYTDADGVKRDLQATSVSHAHDLITRGEQARGIGFTAAEAAARSVEARAHARLSTTDAARLAATLTRKAATIAAAIEARDEAMANAYRAGLAVPAIAKAAGLTRGRVYQILRGRS